MHNAGTDNQDIKTSTKHLLLAGSGWLKAVGVVAQDSWLNFDLIRLLINLISGQKGGHFYASLGLW